MTDRIDTQPKNSEVYAPRVYTPRIITVSVFGDADAPEQEYVTDMANYMVVSWLNRLMLYAVSNGKMVQVEATPTAAINFMPNPNKVRR